MRVASNRVNWKLVRSNIREAIEALEGLEKGAFVNGASREAKEAALEVALGHAYHHLNFAWRGRLLPASRPRKLSAREFRRLSQWPEDLWVVGKDASGEGL